MVLGWCLSTWVHLRDHRGRVSAWRKQRCADPDGWRQRVERGGHSCPGGGRDEPGPPLTEPGRVADELRRIGRQAGLDVVAICDARSVSRHSAGAPRAGRARGGPQACNSRTATPSGRRIPGATLPGAAAIVVGARRYERLDPARSGTDAATLRSPEGRVAMYAWVDHYRPLRAALGQWPITCRHEGWRAKVLVDDNALVDRAAAVRAGVGWYGKNTNVLLAGLGSWFVLGSVVTDAPLTEGTAPPTPVPDGCGPCERCLSACPTGALVGPDNWTPDGVWPGCCRHPACSRSSSGWRSVIASTGATTARRRARSTGSRPDDTSRTSRKPHAQPCGGHPRPADARRWPADGAGRPVVHPGREPRYVRRNALIVLGNTADPADPAVDAAVTRLSATPTRSCVRTRSGLPAGWDGRPASALEADGDPLSGQTGPTGAGASNRPLSPTRRPGVPAGPPRQPATRRPASTAGHHRQAHYPPAGVHRRPTIGRPTTAAPRLTQPLTGPQTPRSPSTTRPSTGSRS